MIRTGRDGGPSLPQRPPGQSAAPQGPRQRLLRAKHAGDEPRPIAHRNGDESLPQPQLCRAVGHEALAGLVRGKATCPVFSIERLQRTINLSLREPTLGFSCPSFASVPPPTDQ
jgi:hypothetical protein